MADFLINRQKKKNFSARETEALLYKWGSRDMQKKFQEAYKHNILWNEIANELKLFERTPSELRTRVSNLKKEYFRLKRTLKPGSPYPDWPYWKLMHAILGRRPVPDRKCTMDSLDIEIKKEVNSSEMCNESGINIENSLEIEIEGQESNFSKYSLEELGIVEDRLRTGHQNSVDVNIVEDRLRTGHQNSVHINVVEDRLRTGHQNSVDIGIVEDRLKTIHQNSVDLHIIEDRLRTSHPNSVDVTNNITEVGDDRKLIINNPDTGRELESPLPSDSVSAASELAFSIMSASSEEELPKLNHHQNKRIKKRKSVEKDAIQELLEAEKRSYELQWKKLQIEIEVAKSMKTFFSSMANMMDRILKPQSSTSSQQQQQPQPAQNANWTVPPANYYPFPFMPNYSQPMPFPPFYQPYSCNNQNNSQNDTNCSTDVNNISKEKNEGNKSS